MNRNWLDNEYSKYRKIPEEAKKYENVDVIGENGIISEECNKIIVFCGPSVILKWRPSLSNFQTKMDI